MNYNTDRAIEKLDEDLLGRAPFSRHLGRAIYEYKGKESLVIGLYGKWGTGKTSVANMAIATINELSKDDEEKPIIVRFAPWNYSDKDSLINQFFVEMQAKLELNGNEQTKKKIGKALSDYAGLFSFASLIPVVGAALAPILKETAQKNGERLSVSADLDSLRKTLENALGDINHKIIVLIDDIDRLTNSQIRDIFQLVKQVGDLPNIIYILAMDREVVERALSGVQNCDGGEYLEKIIQIPFEIPEFRKSKIYEIFFSKLNEVINQDKIEVEIDNSYWGTIFDNCVAPYITTLRDVNRVVNAFIFKYGILREETAFEDLIGITTLEVLEPALYNWIACNKEAVCGGLMHSMMKKNRKPEEWRRQYEDRFSEIGLDPNKSIKSVASLFPVFAEDVGEFFYVDQTPDTIRKRMRAAHEERFELYFMFDIDAVRVSRTVITECIRSLDKEELCSVIDDINRRGDIVFFLREIQSNIDIIPYNRLNILSSVLLEESAAFVGDMGTVLSVSAFQISSFCVEEMLKRLHSNEERFEIYKNALLHSDMHGLESIAQEINRIEIAYGKLAGESENLSEQIISFEQLQELEKIFSCRVNEFDKTEDLLKMEYFSLVFYLWKSFDEESTRKYIEKGFNNNTFTLRFICSFAVKWTGTGGVGWHYKNRIYTDYLSHEEIYDLIQGYGKNHIDEFTELEQIKLASFVLNYDKDDMFQVNEQAAMRLVDEWTRSNV